MNAFALGLFLASALIALVSLGLLRKVERLGKETQRHLEEVQQHLNEAQKPHDDICSGVLLDRAKEQGK